jgi:hypothetical protein
MLVHVNVIPAHPASFFEADIALPNPKWTAVMRVFSHIRAVALHTPDEACGGMHGGRNIQEVASQPSGQNQEQLRYI